MTDGGGTVRDHLTSLAKKGKASAIADLAAHPLPRVWAHLWRHFRELSTWRGGGGMGPSPLTLADVSAYEARFGVTFLAGELDLLKRLDYASLATD